MAISTYTYNKDLDFQQARTFNLSSFTVDSVVPDNAIITKITFKHIHRTASSTGKSEYLTRLTFNDGKVIYSKVSSPNINHPMGSGTNVEYTNIFSGTDPSGYSSSISLGEIVWSKLTSIDLLYRWNIQSRLCPSSGYYDISDTVTFPGGHTITCRGLKTLIVEYNESTLISNITLSKNNLTLKEGETTTLNATISPSNATNKNLSWISSNPSVASVNDGAVLALSEGSATITCSATDGSNISASCFVTVEKEVSEATITELLVYHPITNEILSDYEYITIEQDITAVFKIKVRLSDGSIRELQGGEGYECYGYLPNNTATFLLVQKTSSIEITGLQPTDGLHEWLVIRLKSPYESLAVNLRIEVIEPVIEDVPINTITIPISQSLTVGSSTTLTANISPTNATNKTLYWYSSNVTNNCISISRNSGLITANAEGTAIVYAESAINSSKRSNNCIITVTSVEIKVDSLDLNTNSLSLTVGDNSFLQATIYPSNATNQKINWSMTPSGIVSYSKEAENYITISALAKGITTITARSAENSSILSSCIITVEEEEEESTNIVYINIGGIYVPAKAYIYYNGWKECSSVHIYNNGWQQTKKIT